MDDEDDEEVLVVLDVVLLTFRWGPLYKSCTGGRSASVSTPYRRVRPYGTPSFAQISQKRVLLILSSSILLPFHSHM